MPTITEQYPTLTRREASLILATAQALAAVRDRAGSLSYRNDAWLARTQARVAAAAEQAAGELFDVLVCCQVYASSPQAGAALDRYHGTGGDDVR